MPTLQPIAAVNDPPVDSPWGAFGSLVGTLWASQDFGDKSNPTLPRVYRHFVSFALLDGGTALEVQLDSELAQPLPSRIIVLRPSSRPGVLDGVISQPKVGMTWRTTFRTQDNGALVSDWYKVIDAGHGLREMHARLGLQLLPDGTLAFVGASGWDRDRPALIDPAAPELAERRMRQVSAADMQALVAEQLASYPDIRALEEKNAAAQAELQQTLDRQQRERAARQPSGGGLWSAILGSVVAGAAGAAAGLDSDQVGDLMLRGMSMTAPQNPLSGALDTAGSAAGGSGSYPTKPNLATASCAGFTEANYRTKALEGGPDTQLKTMCGQAFEYYTMYKRAIAQGYSEADANRTYAAHEQSARVASGYLGNGGR